MVALPHALAVACGGALGSVCRWLVAQMPVFEAKATYWPTISVNVIGCLAIGIVAAMFDHYQPDTLWYRLAITGFLGGFTTYSAFSLDAIRLWQVGAIAELGIYIAMTLILGFAACLAGLSLTQKLLHLL